VEINPNHKGKEIFAPNQMMMHSMKLESDHCMEGHEWPISLRYSQNLAIGCGDIDRYSPFHKAHRQIGMYDSW
jgi:hypothetical protein